MPPYRVVVADVPWRFSDKLPGKTRGAERNYRTMSVEEAKRFALPPISDNAWLFFWRVSSMVEEAYEVVRAWGFVPKSEIIWEKLTASGKPHFGMGRYVRAAHETCVVAVRGRVQPAARNVRSRFSAPVGRHSEKPKAFFDLVVNLCGQGPYCELFSRERKPGWFAYGDEVE